MADPRNLSFLRDELSSCQCITTLHGEKKETEKPVLRILQLLKIMVENSRKDIGRFLCLDQKRSGTQLTCTNRTESSIHFNGSDETVEVILPTVVSVNQLSVHGAVVEVCEEVAWEIFQMFECTGKKVALDNLETMVMPTEVSTTDQISPTGARVQRNRLREYEQKFTNLPEHLQLTKICSNAGLAKTVEKKRQYFTMLDGTELDRLKGSCREYTFPRSDQSSSVKRWIRGNTKIGPVLDVIVCYHEDDLCRVDLETGWKYYLAATTTSSFLLHHLGGNNPTASGQHGIGILHHGMSNRFF